MLAIRLAVPSLVLAALLAIAVTAPASASNAVFSCTKDWSGVFVCDQAPAVGQHVQLNTVPGTCHVNINQLRTGRGGVKLADVTIAHNVNGCPWPNATIQTITYAAPTSPAVGGIMGLIQPSAPQPPGSATAPGHAFGPLALIAAAAAAVIAALAVGVRRRQNKMRPARGA